MRAVETYVGDIDPPNAQAILATYRGELAQTCLAFSGTPAVNACSGPSQSAGPVPASPWAFNRWHRTLGSRLGHRQLQIPARIAATEVPEPLQVVASKHVAEVVEQV